MHQTPCVTGCTRCSLRDRVRSQCASRACRPVGVRCVMPVAQRCAQRSRRPVVAARCIGRGGVQFWISLETERGTGRRCSAELDWHGVYRLRSWDVFHRECEGVHRMLPRQRHCPGWPWPLPLPWPLPFALMCESGSPRLERNAQSIDTIGTLAPIENVRRVQHRVLQPRSGAGQMRELWRRRGLLPTHVGPDGVLGMPAAHGSAPRRACAAHGMCLPERCVTFCA
jgi:hypothetical protein